MPTGGGEALEMRESESSLRTRVRERSMSMADAPNDLMSEAIFSPQSIQLGNHPETPIDNVRRLVDSNPAEYPALFCEMMHLSTTIPPEGGPAAGRGGVGTRVAAEGPLDQVRSSLFLLSISLRRFKQIVEGDGTRFSKPHITLLTVHGVLQVKTLLRKGVMLLDAECSSFVRLVDLVIKNWLQSGALEESNAAVVREVLYAPKLHLIDGHVRIVNESSVPISDPHERPSGAEGGGGNAGGQADEKLLRRLPRDTESAAIMVANVGALQRPLSAFVRLKTAANLYPELPDQPYPVKSSTKLPHSSLDRFTVSDAVEEYFSQATLIPPGKCRPDTRWAADVGDDLPIRNIGKMYSTANEEDVSDEEGANRQSSLVIRRSGRLFGGLVDDVNAGRISQSLGAVIVLFFSNLIVAITFGAVYERATHQQMAAIESMVSACLCGITFALFGGQPLTIMSATGATFIFEKVTYDFCTANDWDFLPFRFWMSCWIAVLFLLLIATDASALVGLITRFTEEGFATVVSVAFIVQACQKIYELSYEAPITWRPQAVIDSTCYCFGYFIKNLSIGVTRCRALGGTPQGLACFFKPDILIFSILLAICTFFVSLKLTEFPPLALPCPTMERSWIVDVFAIESYYVALVAFVPAFFFTILLVMDQQISSGIVNRKENKLKKGYGVHLDLLVLLTLILACALLGLPFYAASPVLTVNHLDSLRFYSEIAAPGEKARFLGVK
ncbi:Anion exchange protein [Aphelenchoides fujianensis]|nr:Anion exchange protein [Aphelenchoides fujianensis]